MKPMNYTCRKCGETNTITSFWRWFWTPHFGASKWIKCVHCERRNFMPRDNWNHPWIDWWR